MTMDIYTSIYKLVKAGDYKLAIHSMIDLKSGQLKPPFKRDANRAWYCVGDAYFKAEDFLEAVAAFQRARKANPEDAMCFLALGNSYDAIGRPKLAERMFRKALCMHLDSFERASVLFNLGNALYDQGRYAEAAQQYQRVKIRKDEVGEKARKNLTRVKAKIKNDTVRNSKT
jgi:tetratricopeptide (TPR) repeat protein